ncbi:MAG: MMPL family transporter [Rhizobiaceae bacterium]|nr:MMPL family transporter [Rhizobiaceae bacterium]
MMNGFGLEKLGLAALRYPVFATVMLLVACVAAGIGITKLQFSGENIEILRDGSQELANYDELLSEFRDFNNDAVILMRVPNLATIDGIETFRELNFEFQLDDRVESILSIFSLVKYAGPEQGWQSALPAVYESDEQVLDSLKQLAIDIPSSQSLFSENFDSAVMVVYTKAEAIVDANVRETMWGLEELGKEFETDEISISIAGQPAIRSDLIRSIASDITYLAPIAVILCAILAFLLFKSPIAMFLCAFPSLLAIFWFLGGAGLAGTSLNFLTNILPVLLIVIIFADTLHLYLKWQSLSQKSDDTIEALRNAIEEIGPACGISSLTTGAALLSLCFSGNNGLFELGIVGAVAVLAGFIAIMVGLPVAAYWTARLGFRPKGSNTHALASVAGPAMRALRWRKIVFVAGVVLCGLGLYAHAMIDSRFRLIDYLGSASEVGQSEGYIDQTYNGTTPLFAVVDMDQSLPLDDPANENRVYETINAVTDVFPAGSFYSLADFADEIKKSGGKISADLIDQIPRALTSRFISADKEKVLVTIFSSANLSASEMQVRLSALQEALDKRNLSETVRITGYPVLSGVVAPRLMDNLRVSLLIAVALSILIISLAAASWRLGLACLVPNLLPIVMVELILYASGIPLNLSITVALTVAFGIAVDDSVHMLNQYMINRKDHDTSLAVQGALKDVTPAIFSTTLILSGGLIVMSFSSLPAMAVFSAVVIMTLVIAFLADIFQLPAYLVLMDRKKA